MNATAQPSMHMLTSTIDTLHLVEEVQMYPEESRGRKALWRGVLLALLAQGAAAVLVVFLVRLFLHAH
jgi:hypothetical protein